MEPLKHGGNGGLSLGHTFPVSVFLKDLKYDLIPIQHNCLGSHQQGGGGSIYALIFLAKKNEYQVSHIWGMRVG